MVTSFKSAHSATLNASAPQQPTAYTCLHWKLLDTCNFGGLAGEHEHMMTELFSSH